MESTVSPSQHSRQIATRDTTNTGQHFNQNHNETPHYTDDEGPAHWSNGKRWLASGPSTPHSRPPRNSIRAIQQQTRVSSSSGDIPTNHRRRRRCYRFKLDQESNIDVERQRGRQLSWRGSHGALGERRFAQNLPRCSHCGERGG